MPAGVLSRHVAWRLGIDVAMAQALLRQLQATVGRSQFWVRALGLIAADRGPLALVGGQVRRRALNGFLGPLLAVPTASIAFAAGRGDPWAAECAGLMGDD